MSKPDDLPLYLAAYKLTKYLYLLVKNFPKSYKYTLGQVGSLSLPTGKRVMDKSPLKVRLNFTYQQVVDNPVRKVSGKDFPDFRIRDYKAD